MLLVSVVMTSYNHEKYLADAIESVLNQTFSDFELIIVDDASRDNSPEIIRQYQQKDPRVRAIFRPDNQGISKTKMVIKIRFKLSRNLDKLKGGKVWLFGQPAVVLNPVKVPRKKRPDKHADKQN